MQLTEQATPKKHLKFYLIDATGGYVKVLFFLLPRILPFVPLD